MIRKVFLFLSIMTLLTFINGCSFSPEQEIDTITTSVMKTLKGAPKETTNQTTSLNFYLPANYTVEEDRDQNIIIRNGSQLYVLFFNPNEDEQSKVVYDSTLLMVENAIVNRSEMYNKEWLYFIIDETESDVYRVTVGVGGIKITTEARKSSDLKLQAITMAQILRSAIPQ